MAAEMDPGLASRLGATVELCAHGKPSATYCPECIDAARLASEERARATLMAVAPTGLSPAEAVYGLLGWLMSRGVATTFTGDGTSVDELAQVSELAKSFCSANGLGGNLRPDWERNLTHPSGPPTDHEASAVAVPEGQSD